MSWFTKLLPSKVKVSNDGKKGVPEGIWSKCTDCNSFLFKNELERNLYVCPKCNHHMRIGARKRIDAFLDPSTGIEIAGDIEPIDRLKFKDTKKYRDRLNSAQKATGEKDALIVKYGNLKGKGVVVCAFEFDFIGGSMGTVVGAKFTAAANYAIDKKVPLICFAASGGVRMQESVIGLMQMSKTAAILARLSEVKLPYISVLTDPCTGGVSASLAMLGDLNVAEPKALIGFAGQKVIEQTVREILPEGFQRSEFLLEKGFLDMIIDRRDMRDTLDRLLSKMIA